MLTYIIRRVISLIPVIIVSTLITFLLMHAVPGGPADTANAKIVNPAVKRAINAKFHLDEPLAQQYIDYMWGALHGDLGPSFSTPVPVAKVLSDGFPISASLGLGALILSIVVGVPLGIFAALNHNKLIDQISLFIVTIGISIPTFVIALFAIVLFSITFNILPYQFQRDQWQSWIMPVVILSLGPIALMLRLTRASTLDVLSEDYIRTARAKGLPALLVNWRHVLRNALIPIATLIGPLTAGLITGSFQIETIFGAPGIGRIFVASVLKRDYDQLMGSTLFIILIIVLFNLAVDLTYSFIDPRIARG